MREIQIKKSQTAHKGLSRHTSAIFLIILCLQSSTVGKSTQRAWVILNFHAQTLIQKSKCAFSTRNTCRPLKKKKNQIIHSHDSGICTLYKKRWSIIVNGYRPTGIMIAIKCVFKNINEIASTICTTLIHRKGLNTWTPDYKLDLCA